MLVKQPIGKGRFYDLAHRGFVFLCVGLTAAGILNIVALQFRKYKGSAKLEEIISKPGDEPQATASI